LKSGDAVDAEDDGLAIEHELMGAAIPKVTHAFLAGRIRRRAGDRWLPPPKNNKLHSPHCPLKSKVAEADHGNPEIVRVNSAVVF